MMLWTAPPYNSNCYSMGALNREKFKGNAETIGG